jgi:NAD(P)-dependent dehydrogenase (short-subunit alcohol dehydrogenase family)
MVRDAGATRWRSGAGKRSLLKGLQRSSTCPTITTYGQEFFERGRMHRAVKRIQKPEDLVGTVIFIAARESDFITGASILVNGGHHMYEQTRADVCVKSEGGEL